SAPRSGTSSPCGEGRSPPSAGHRIPDIRSRAGKGSRSYVPSFPGMFPDQIMSAWGYATSRHDVMIDLLHLPRHCRPAEALPRRLPSVPPHLVEPSGIAEKARESRSDAPIQHDSSPGLANGPGETHLGGDSHRPPRRPGLQDHVAEILGAGG